MRNFFFEQPSAAYSSDEVLLLQGDSFAILEKMIPETVDMVFADPPYFLSDNGITCRGGKMVSVNKGEWDNSIPFEEKHCFNRTWIRLCKRILKLNGSIWISGTFHNIYSIGVALEQEGFTIINNITWQKTNPPPNLACRCFTHSTETVLWAQKKDKNARHLFNYQLMKEQNNGKQMKDVWSGALTPKSEKTFGKHPTQKPLYLLRRIIEASTNEGDTILDPFCGSSTTGVAALQLNRHYIGIDCSNEYITLSKKRLQEEEEKNAEF